MRTKILICGLALTMVMAPATSFAGPSEPKSKQIEHDPDPDVLKRKCEAMERYGWGEYQDRNPLDSDERSKLLNQAQELRKQLAEQQEQFGRAFTGGLFQAIFQGEADSAKRAEEKKNKKPKC